MPAHLNLSRTQLMQWRSSRSWGTCIRIRDSYHILNMLNACVHNVPLMKFGHADWVGNGENSEFWVVWFLCLCQEPNSQSAFGLSLDLGASPSFGLHRWIVEPLFVCHLLGFFGAYCNIQALCMDSIPVITPFLFRKQYLSMLSFASTLASSWQQFLWNT